MFPEDPLRPGLDLAKGDRLETARALQAKRKPSDPGKEIQDAKLARHCLADKI